MSSSESINSPVGRSESQGLIRTAIFKVLTVMGAATWLYTWFQPWWVAYIEELKQNGVVIKPFAMTFSGTLRNYPQWLVGAEMPSWFFPLMWVYLGVCLFALLASTLYDDEWFQLGKFKLSLSSVLIGFAGFAMTIFVIVFPIVISIRAPEFNGVTLQGSVFVSMDEHTESYVTTSLQASYWIACVVGPVLLAMSILRNKIVGKS